jgi:hypothetical protein
LANFLPDDAPLAATLLDSLRIVSEAEFRAALTRMLTETLEEKVNDGPVALYSVRPPRASASYIEPHPNRPYEPDAGSELIVANIISELTKTFSERAPLIAASPTLEELRASRFRHVIFVDDYSGTGSSILSYLNLWLRNRTIRSWRSFGLIKFHLAMYALSPRAKQALHRHKLLDSEPKWVEFGLDFDSMPWTDDERKLIRQICTKYAANSNMALGFRRSEGTLVMGHTLPNNLPLILRYGRRWDGHPWAGFFPPGYRRLSPDQQLRFGGYRPPRLSLEAMAVSVGDRKLARGRIADVPHAQPLLLALAALRRGIRNPNRLARDLALSSFEIERVVRAAKELGLVDDHLHLTDRGHDELRQATTRPRRVGLELRGNDEPYYPASLRGVSAT